MAEFRRKMRRRFFIELKHGKDTAEFFEAVEKEGLTMEGDEEKILKLAEAKANSSSSETHHLVTRVGSDGRGGMEATISFDSRAHKEAGINAAIKSLGDRTDDDPKQISADLKKALRERDLGLEEDLRMQIATSLAKGDEVVIGVQSGS
jgi:hypothetical protein